MIRIYLLGRLKSPEIKRLFQEYLERLSRLTRIEAVELKDPQSLMDRDKRGAVWVVLDQKGENPSSTGLSEFIKEHHLTRDLCFIVGGPEGLYPELLNRADKVLSLSNMTVTSQLTALLLVEQIYRSYTLIKGVKYHK